MADRNAEKADLRRLYRVTTLMQVGDDPRAGFVLRFDTEPRKPSTEWLREARKVRGS